MAAKSRFKLSPTFKSDIKKLRVGVLVAAEAAMEDGILMSELEAKEQAKWGADGSQGVFMTDDTIWSWGISGMSRAAIAGYIASKGKKAKLAAVSRADTISMVNGSLFRPHKHTAKPPKTLSAEMNKVKAVLTRYGPYAGYLEAKELSGTDGSGDSAHPFEGGPTAIQVAMGRWRSFIVPTIVIPRFKQEMARVISTLGK